MTKDNVTENIWILVKIIWASKVTKNQCIDFNVINHRPVFVRIMNRQTIYASGKIVTRIHVYFVTLQIIHGFLLL